MIFGLVAAGVAVAQEGGIAPVPPASGAVPFSEERKQEMLAALKTGNVLQQTAILDELLKTGKAAIPVFMAALDIPDTYVQTYALKVIARFEGERALPVIIPFTESKDIYVKHTAVALLGTFRSSEAVTTLLGVAEKGAERTTRVIAIGALGRTEDGGVIPALERFLKGNDPLIQCAAAGALGRLGNRSGLAVALRERTSADYSVKDAAVHALGTIGGPEAMEALRDTLKKAPKISATRDLAIIGLKSNEMKGKGPREKVRILEGALTVGGSVGLWAIGEFVKIGTPEAAAVLKANLKDARGKGRPNIQAAVWMLEGKNGGEE